MAREWKIADEGEAMNRAMEEMLVEIFGCMPVNGSRDGQAAKAGKGARRGYTLGAAAMEDMLIEVFGCIDKPAAVELARNRRRMRVDFGQYVNAMEARLIETFGGSPAGSRTAKGEAVKGRKRVRFDFAGYVNGMDDAIIEAFGCTPPDYRVIDLQVVRERRRAFQEKILETQAVGAEVIQMPRVLRR